MSELHADLKRVIAAARLVPPEPGPPPAPGLAARVLAAAREHAPEEISGRMLGAIFLTSGALALVWAFVFVKNTPAGSDQTFNEIATRMVTSVGH